MPFVVIKGTFHVVGYSPDGDSIRFKADNPDNWTKVDGRKVKLNAKGHAQLRVEAIDTLETHYHSRHQPPALADAATLKLFNLLGIRDVEWYPSRSRVRAASDGTAGYIVTRRSDMFGRPISFLFKGKAPKDDGESVYMGKTLGRRSINYKMLRYGLAYPAFYDGLFYDLRAIFLEETRLARKAKKGVWKRDRSNRFFTVKGFDTLEESAVVMPKLFRRMVKYLRSTDGVWNALEFIEFSEENSDKVFAMRHLHFTHLDNLIEVDKRGRIRLVEKPENMIFIA